MSVESKKLVLREELGKSARGCMALSQMLQRKIPNSTTPPFSKHDEIVSATRYWGCRIMASLTAVRDDGQEKILAFSRNCRDPEVPLHVEPLILPEPGAFVFSPIAGAGFDFSPLSRLHGQLGEEAAKSKTPLENFFYWAAEQLDSRNINGYIGEIRIERYKLADRFVYRHDGREYGIWGNADTDEAWEEVPAIGSSENRECLHVPEFASFICVFVLVAMMMWSLAAGRNGASSPPFLPGNTFGSLCVVLAVIAGIFLRGWPSKLVSLLAVVSGSYLLIPWLGESWDMMSEMALLLPFAAGDLAEAPVGAVYIASALALTTLALAAAPSFSLKVHGSHAKRAIAGAVLALAVSPWPAAVVSMPERSSLPIQLGVWLFALICLFAIGNCGWVVSGRHASSDDIRARVARTMRPSPVFTGVATAIVALLLFNQLSVLIP